jgi:hypothetical protein
MTDIMKVLIDLGVDPDSAEHKCYRFQSSGFMDLIVETWRVGEWLHVSMAHYYMQEGDMMADPEIEFRVRKVANGKAGWEVQPIHYQQDNLALYQQAMNYQDGQLMVKPKLQRELRNFLEYWVTNIKGQDYVLKIKE